MSTAQKHTAPALRFKDEVGRDYPDWEEKFVRDICEINPSNGGLPNQFTYIDLYSVYQGMLVNENKISKSSAPSRAQRILKKNDVLFQTVRPYQQNNFFFDLTGDYVASTGYAQLRTKSSPQFLYHLLHEQKFVRKVLARCTGTSYPAINSSDVGAIRIHLPDEKEQQKIAAFLSAVDTKIEQLNRKKSLLEQYKKGMMQKLFSREIRFKDEDGRDYPEWAEKKLGEVAEFYSGGTPSTAITRYYSGNIPFIKSGEISSSTTEQFISEEGLNNSSAKKVNKGDILYALYGATSGEVAISKIDGAINQAVLCIKSQLSHRARSYFLS